ncbi:hypothetical protein HYY75_03120, partial [bacterium]|nr:hypothetical protein [bacterium]
FFVTMFLFCGCFENDSGKSQNKSSTQQAVSKQQNPEVSVSAIFGTIVETMDSGGYTYAKIDTGKEKVWVAAPQQKVKIGEKVQVPECAPMKNFHSKTMNRDFEMIYFSPGFKSENVLVPLNHPPLDNLDKGNGDTQNLDFSAIKKIDGGKTIAELYGEKASLNGGEKNSEDLTLTTLAAAKVGDTVVAGGVLNLEKDFGYGYKYDIILEDANLIIE